VLSFFSSRRNGDSPNPSTAGECAPPFFDSGGRGTLAGERGVGRVPIPTNGHTLWYSVNTYTYFVTQRFLAPLARIHSSTVIPPTLKLPLVDIDTETDRKIMKGSPLVSTSFEVVNSLCNQRAGKNSVEIMF
jgi:hypothetical protein